MKNNLQLSEKRIVYRTLMKNSIDFIGNHQPAKTVANNNLLHSDDKSDRFNSQSSAKGAENNSLLHSKKAMDLIPNHHIYQQKLLQMITYRNLIKSPIDTENNSLLHSDEESNRFDWQTLVSENCCKN